MFKRASHEKELELATTFSSRYENIARRRKDAQQLDLAYLLLAASCQEGDLPQKTPSSCDGKSEPPVGKTAEERLVSMPSRPEGDGTNDTGRE